MNAQSVLNLNHFHETQNKIGPDFEIGSASFSPGLINSCINAGTKQETPAHKVLTHLLDIRLNKCFHFILHISGVSCANLGPQVESDSFFFFFEFFFFMWTIFKIFIAFITILLPFYVLVFWP